MSEDGDEWLFLVGLQYATAPLDYKALEQAFAALSDTTPQAPNADFAAFVAVALSRPVSSAAFLRELSDFCTRFRDFVDQDPKPGSVPPPPSPAARARLGAGVIAVALAPIDAGRAAREPLRVLVVARRLLHEAQSFACDYDGAVALPLEDYGVLLTVPLQAGAKAPPKADGARKLAEKLRQFAHTRLQLSTVAGTAPGSMSSNVTVASNVCLTMT